MRLIVRPGLQVLRRDVRTLQLGLDWPGVTSVPDSPALQAALAAIDGCRDVDQVVARAVGLAGVEKREVVAALDVLIACGAVVDQAKTRRSTVSEQTWAALWLLAGPERDPHDLLAARVSCAVDVRGSGLVASEVRRGLVSSGLGGGNGGGSGGGRGSSSGANRPVDVVVVAADNEPEREAADSAMHRSLPHLWVWVREVVGVVGPFVMPGETACLRCVDAAKTDLDAAWPTLVAATAARPLTAPACDQSLAALVAALAVHEVGVWASGLRPQSWGRVIELPQGCGLIDSEVYEVHPRCGCGWAQWRDTMGA